MRTCTCDMCGRQFEARGNTKACPECRVATCVVCGKKKALEGAALTKYRQRGYWCCSPKCASTKLRRENLERYGVEFLCQTPEVRERIKAGIAAEPDEVKQARRERIAAVNKDEAVKAKRAATNLERYGSVSPLGLEENRAKGVEAARSDEAKAKRRRTNLERRGIENNFGDQGVLARAHASANSPEGRAKAAQTCMERYGVKSPYLIPEVRERCWDEESRAKRVETSMERFGTEHPFQSEEVKAKRAATNMERYGDEQPSRSEAVKQAMRDKREEKYGDPSIGSDTVVKIKEYAEAHPSASVTEVAKAVGVNDWVVYDACKRHGVKIKKHQSYLEHLMADYLDSLGATYIVHDRKTIAPMELDFLAEGPDGRKVAIEVNDVLTHNSTYSPYGAPKPKRYHYEKTVACREKGIPLVHAWEWCMPGSEIDSGRMGSWEVLKNRIAHALGMTPNRIGARELKVVEMAPKACAEFFRRNNVNGPRGAKTVFALVGKDVESPTWEDVYMAYAVGDAHLGGRKDGKAKYDAEIARGACRLGWEVMGGASKLWKAITEATDENGSYRWDSLEYFVDNNYYGAESVSTLPGIEYKGWSPSFWNYWVAENRLRNRDPAHNAEVKAAREAGLVWEVYGAGTETYVWERDRAKPAGGRGGNAL